MASAASAASSSATYDPHTALEVKDNLKSISGNSTSCSSGGAVRSVCVNKRLQQVVVCCSDGKVSWWEQVAALDARGHRQWQLVDHAQCDVVQVRRVLYVEATQSNNTAYSFCPFPIVPLRRVGVCMCARMRIFPSREETTKN
jgi:hypothetical protein